MPHSRSDVNAVSFLGRHLATSQGDADPKILLKRTCVPRCVLSGGSHDDDAATRRNGSGDGIRQAAPDERSQCSDDRARRFADGEPVQQGLSCGICSPLLRARRSLESRPSRGLCFHDVPFSPRVPRWNRERQHLGGRGEETRGNATSSLIQSGRQFRDR